MSQGELELVEFTKNVPRTQAFYFIRSEIFRPKSPLSFLKLRLVSNILIKSNINYLCLFYPNEPNQAKIEQNGVRNDFKIKISVQSDYDEKILPPKLFAEVLRDEAKTKKVPGRPFQNSVEECLPT